MSNFSDFYGGGIKSVQRGVSTPVDFEELNVTVAGVNPSRSTLNLLSGISSATGTGANISLRLINGTTIGLKSYVNGSASGSPCSWELIEFL